MKHILYIFLSMALLQSFSAFAQPNYAKDYNIGRPAYSGSPDGYHNVRGGLRVAGYGYGMADTFAVDTTVIASKAWATRQHSLQAVTDVDSTTTRNVSVGKLIITSSIDVGSPDAGFRSRRVIRDALSYAGHGIKMQDSFDRDGTGGYASFDDETVVIGTNNDHYVSVQLRPVIVEGGNMNDFYAMWSEPVIASGNIHHMHRIYIGNPTGGGTVDTNIGYHFAQQTKGSVIMPILTEGTHKSMFTGGFYTGLTGTVGIGKAYGATLTENLDVTGGIVVTDNIRADGNNFYYHASSNGLAINLGTTPSYPLHVGGSGRFTQAVISGGSAGSYNAYYVNGLGGNFGTIQRTDANYFSLGWDTNVTGDRLGTPVLTWNTSGNVLINKTSDNSTGKLQVEGGISTPGTTGNTFRVNNSTSAPSDTVTPDAWMLVNIAGTEYKIAAFTP